MEEKNSRKQNYLAASLLASALGGGLLMSGCNRQSAEVQNIPMPPNGLPPSMAGSKVTPPPPSALKPNPSTTVVPPKVTR